MLNLLNPHALLSNPESKAAMAFYNSIYAKAQGKIKYTHEAFNSWQLGDIRKYKAVVTAMDGGNADNAWNSYLPALRAYWH